MDFFETVQRLDWCRPEGITRHSMYMKSHKYSAGVALILVMNPKV
jgi:hypothetical protein